VIELIVETFRNLVYGVLGEEHGKRYLPYVGSLFLFILLNNLMGIVPFLRSPTSAFQTTFALGICTFCYVQFTAVRFNGVIGYFYHLAGEPKGDNIFMTIFMWLLGIFLLLPLHVLGELIKPISLSLRLFGNILGEDILIGVFAAMGLTVMSLTGWDNPVVGFPLQLPFFFLALLTSTVQALVFALLSMVYFLMVLPHHEEEH
jgi:F-type H+-transporting ATPase subunit a